jgi:anaerobic selenocysteine-containing dehydrogenase
MKEAKSFCRMCGAMCGTTLSLDDNDRLIKVMPDNDNPLSKGYACYKGLYADEMHNHPERLLHTMKRTKDGEYVRIDTEQALDEIAAKIKTIISESGNDAVASYTGSHTYLTSSAWIMLPMFRQALGTSSYYSTATIDQSSKFVTADRLGVWAAGKPSLEESDTVMLIGTNPLVAHATAGCLTADPVKRLKKERARGLKLIVIDPRRSETAAYADVFLQPWPGEDATVIAGLIREILVGNMADNAFIKSYVKAGGLEKLREMVEPFNPEYVAQRAGISAQDLRLAAQMFGQSKKGAVFSGTGPSMAPQANLNEHLVECLNIICGRFRRAGDSVKDVAVLLPPKPFHAQVVAPSRSFELGGPGRIRGANSLWGEKMTSTLPDEILTPGEGQVRCLINAGGNPASSFPDQNKTIKALKSLDLLVSIQPFLSTTARLADYVFAPKLQYERADIPMYIFDMSFYPESWTQFTPALVKPPKESDLVDDWYVFWGIAKRLGLQLNYSGVDINMDTAPTTEELIALRCAGSVVPLDEVKRYPSGKIFELNQSVQPPLQGADGKFDVMPEDVQKEMQLAYSKPDRDKLLQQGGFTHQLQVRRIRETNNSSTVMLDAVHKRMPTNWATMNPQDANNLGLVADSKVKIRSAYGEIEALVRNDESIRSGVVAVTHCWGGLPGESEHEPGSNVNQLISTEHDIEPINAMVRMSAIPVEVTALA